MERSHWGLLGGRGRRPRTRRPGVERLEGRALLAAFTSFPIPTAGSTPVGIVTGPDGNLWFTEQNANNIGRLVPATGTITEFPVTTPGALPTGISAGPPGDANLYFTETGVSQIGQINDATGVVTETAVPTAGSSPEGIALGPDGNLWFTETGADKIGMINPVTDTITEYALPTSGAQPTGITAGPPGTNTLYFTEAAVNQIGRITTSGAVTEFSLLATGVGATGITLGPDDNLYFTENIANAIGQFNPAQVITATGVAVTATQGVPFTGTVATFAAPNLTLPASSYSATIDWGDGTTPTPAQAITENADGTFTVTGAHTYAAVGTFTITVGITDTGGDFATATATATVAPPPPAPPPPPEVLGVARLSYSPGVILLHFDTALDPATAENVNNYTIVRLSPTGTLDTADQIADGQATNLYIHVQSATYIAATDSVILNTYEPLFPNRLFLLDVNGRPAHPTANGESPNGLQNVNGLLLSGDFSGVAGSDFVTLLPLAGAPLGNIGTTTTTAATTAGAVVPAVSVTTGAPTTRRRTVIRRTAAAHPAAVVHPAAHVRRAAVLHPAAAVPHAASVRRAAVLGPLGLPTKRRK